MDILRHGEALPAGSAGDRRRPLSPAGVRILQRLALRLAGESWKPDRIFSSPLDRALASADILASATGSAPAIEVLGALEPGSDPEDVTEALAELGVTSGHLLVVGHQPQLGRLIGRLTGQEIGLSPGTLIQVDCPGPPGRSRGEIVRTLVAEDPERD